MLNIIQVQLLIISTEIYTQTHGLAIAETTYHIVQSPEIMRFHQLLRKLQGVKNRPKSAKNRPKKRINACTVKEGKNA